MGFQVREKVIINFELNSEEFNLCFCRKFHSPEYDIEIRMLGSPNLNDNFKETLGGKSKKNFDSNNQLKSTFYDNYGSDTSSEFSVDLSNHQ